MKNVTLDDIVFENRNKEFGAYDLRVHYAERLTLALKIMSGIVFLICLLAFKFSKEKPTLDEAPEYKITVFDPIEIKPKQVKEKKQRSTAPKAKVLINLPPNPVEVLDKPEVKMHTADELFENRTGPVEIEGPASDPDLLDVGNLPSGPEIVIDKPADPIIDPNIALVSADENPDYPGGMEAMRSFLSKNMQYPRVATSNGVSGRVIVQFIVERDGSIAQAKVIKSIGFGCDEEALRVVNKMPKWKPGVNNGQKVRVYYTLPIYFQLDN